MLVLRSAVVVMHCYCDIPNKLRVVIVLRYPLQWGAGNLRLQKIYENFCIA